MKKIQLRISFELYLMFCLALRVVMFLYADNTFEKSVVVQSRDESIRLDICKCLHLVPSASAYCNPCNPAGVPSKNMKLKSR